ncbi:MAG: hypothetical protein HYX41_00165 [Bdellovibrio sp.]|nr:hypothetical protein [Bdellovibrio sp.]
MKTFLFCLVLGLFNLNAAASSTSPSYIDEIKRQMREQGEDLDKKSGEGPSYIESIKRSDTTEVEDSRGYTERIRKAIQDDRVEGDDRSYTEVEKIKLEPKPEGGAIQAVLDGKSELSAKKKGDIHFHAGLRYGVAMAREITAARGYQGADFGAVYGSQYAPDFAFFYEYQPFHSEWFGSFGILGMLGLGYYRGLGQFSYSIPKPGGGTFSQSSSTAFTLYVLPVTVGVSYRFNLFRLLRQFIIVGPTAIAYYEARIDDASNKRAYSFSMMGTVGVSVLLDWMEKTGTFDLYSLHGVHHLYLNVDYSRWLPFPGDFSFAGSALTVGLSLEF